MDDDDEVELSFDSFLNELLGSPQTCTHTHTCNPPASPGSAHTHTCHHTHTRVQTADGSKSPRPPPSGNREAVRKYREKKRAHTAYLEEEVKKLRLVNQNLTRKLQRRGVLEMEASRLRGLLVDITGKIDGELGNE